MFVFDPLVQGLELLAQRELQGAEYLFLRVINDPYAQSEELQQARKYLRDIRLCQSGEEIPDFDQYKKIAKKTSPSLIEVNEFLKEIYFSDCEEYADFDQYLETCIPRVIGKLKQIKIRDVIARDQLFESIEASARKFIKKNLNECSDEARVTSFDSYRWKTIYRKFIQQMNPILLERHLEMLEYILESGNMDLLEDPKLTTLTPKYRWIIESTLKTKWFLLRSYFFKAKSEVREQFFKKEGTRKYWEEVKYKKIRIFEQCGFHEKNIQKFLYIDKLNYQTLEEIHDFAQELKLPLIPRDVSLALRGVQKAKDHIKERGGFLLGTRKEFQDELIELGFSKENSYKIARQAKRANNHQILNSYKLSLEVATNEIYWYRVSPTADPLTSDLQEQCCKHLSTVRIHLFDRGRLNKLLLKSGKPMIREYLKKIYGEDVVSLHCYFRLETIHQFYKLKFFEYHSDQIPSVSELIKISRKEFEPIILEGYKSFLKSKRLTIPSSVYDENKTHSSVTDWEDPYTTPEEKILLKVWYLMDHGISITQGIINKGWLGTSASLGEIVNGQS